MVTTTSTISSLSTLYSKLPILTLLLLYGLPKLEVEEDGVDHHSRNNHCIQSIEEGKVFPEARSFGCMRGSCVRHVHVGLILCRSASGDITAVNAVQELELGDGIVEAVRISVGFSD